MVVFTGGGAGLWGGTQALNSDGPGTPGEPMIYCLQFPSLKQPRLFEEKVR